MEDHILILYTMYTGCSKGRTYLADVRPSQDILLCGSFVSWNMQIVRRESQEAYEHTMREITDENPYELAALMERIRALEGFVILACKSVAILDNGV